MAGFKQALSDFTKSSKELIRSASGEEKSSKWYPGVICSVIQENVPDSFGVRGRGSQLVDSARALVVNEKITSSQHLDVFVSLPTKQEKLLYGRVIRIVTLMDDYNGSSSPSHRPGQRLRKSPELFSDYIALIYSSIWSYALNIPFPKVPNYPSPIKFAEHYASWQYSILTDHDTDLRALRIDVDNAKPRICTVVPEEEETTNTMKVENQRDGGHRRGGHGDGGHGGDGGSMQRKDEEEDVEMKSNNV